MKTTSLALAPAQPSPDTGRLLPRGDGDDLSYLAQENTRVLRPVRLSPKDVSTNNSGRYYVYNIPFAPPHVRIAVRRTLKPADAHATRALLYAMMSRRSNTDILPRTSEELRTCACQELASVFQDAPTHTLGLAVKTWVLDEEIDVARAQRSAEEAPKDWMAWWLLAATLRRHGIDDQRAVAAETKAATLAAGNPVINLKVVLHVRQ